MWFKEVIIVSNCFIIGKYKYIDSDGVLANKAILSSISGVDDDGDWSF